ncbi:MAG: hypothetical protein GY858_01300 [Candidatus Omnitrophica bacterium]|nr:hypothetical protein [Candidatus Omnitrophota bacterium]
MKFKKIFVKNVWFEIIVLSVVNTVLLGILIWGYSLSSRLPAMLVFLLFLFSVIIHSYKHKFESLQFDLSKKGKLMIFMRACLPYILQTLLYTQCALLVAWILFNMSAGGK